MKILKINEYMSVKQHRTHLPTYEEAVQMCTSGKKKNAIFYENKYVVDGYNVSVFNYRLASYTDFTQPIEGKDINAYEMRGLTFVFNKDGSLFNRYILLEKFFNLNQVTETMYNIVKDYKIKYINNKEDGSVASFVKLPNGKVVGKSKMSFESEQANGINRCYQRNKELREFVNWTLDNDITAIFEYVAPHNRIVLRYTDEELILLKLRDNKTGKHIDIKNHLDKIGDIKVAPFEEDKSLDDLIELMAVQTNKEGCVVHAVDDNGHDFFFKLKTAWYCERHGLLTNDLYREHVIVNYILDDKIDDVLGQVPEDEVEARNRIDRIIDIVREEVSDIADKMKELFDDYLEIKKENQPHYIRKFLAQKYRKSPFFGALMMMVNADELKDMPKSEWIEKFNSYDDYNKAIERGDPFELAKGYIRKNCDKLEKCRKWLKKKDPSLFFIDKKEEEDNM